MLYQLIFAAAALLSPAVLTWLSTFPPFVTEVCCHPGWLGVGVTGLYCSRHTCPQRRLSVRVLVVTHIGLVVGSWQMDQLKTQQLPALWDKKEVHATVLINRIGNTDGRSALFEGRVVALDCGKPCPPILHKTLRFSWYAAPAIALGDEWHFLLKLKQLHGFANPGGFDFHAYQLARGLTAAATVRGGERRAQHPPKGLDRVRTRLLATLTQHGQPQQDQATVLYSRFYRAIAIGDTSGLDWQDWQILQRTGTIHLMAISGFQVGLMAWVGFVAGALLGRIFSLCSPGSGAWMIRFWPWCLAVSCAWFYTALAQYAVPAVRALAAVLVLNSAVALGWRPSIFQVLTWTLVWVVMTEPLVALNTGFWLSFIAVLALLVVFSTRLPTLWWRDLLTAQVTVSLGLLMPLFMLQLAFSVTSPIANLVVAPLVSVVITPGVLLALAASFVGWETPIFQLLDALYGYCWQLLTTLSNWPASLWWPYKPLGWAEASLGILATAILFLPRGLAMGVFASVLLAIVLLLPGRPKAGLAVRIMDVGQGLAVVIETPHHTLLYDAGPAYSAQFDAGTGVLLPYFISRGVHSTHLILSRDKADHSGGLRGLQNNVQLDGLKVGEVITALPGAPRCQRGQQWRLDDVHFRVLWPPETGDYYGGNRACVLLIEFGKEQILLTGDIDKNVERQLLQEGFLPARIRLLVAPNHGSPSSSSRAFIQALNPQLAVFSTARYNPYGQPNTKVLKIYQELSVPTLNTADSGSVQLTWSAVGLPPHIETERQVRPRPWYAW